MKGKLNYNNTKRKIDRKKSFKSSLIFSTGNNSTKRKVLSPGYSVNKTRQMNWKQLNKRFPGMDPNADADFDGLVNCRDCKPLDPSKDGAFSRFLGVITGGKKGQSAEDYKAEKQEKSSAKFEKKLSMDVEKGRAEEKRKIAEKWKEIGREKARAKKEIIKEKARAVVKSKVSEKFEKGVRSLSPTIQYRTKIVDGKKVRVATRIPGKRVLTAGQKRSIVKTVEKFSGVRDTRTQARKTAKGQPGAGAGRPKQSYKYRDPRTGQPISAVDYHALRKQLKKQAQTVETQAEVQQRFALAKRGLSPEEVSVAQEEINARMARLRAIKAASQETVEVAEPQAQYQQVQVQPQQVQIQPQYRRTQNVNPMATIPGSTGIPPGYRLQEDIMTGRKKLVPLPQPEAWTR